VRALLRKVAERHDTDVLHATEYMDDGSPIELKVVIDAEKGSAIFDFTGTGPEMRGNLNAPISVTYSAVIYSLRAMVDEDIPLNAGCLAPITGEGQVFRHQRNHHGLSLEWAGAAVVIPPNSILDPSETCAVVGGNVVTSQRVTDVILKAFGAVAASQGDW
jgi:N-methylhydantoinase B/oxoprolinase/acetone carboxylase alpha subunit